MSYNILKKNVKFSGPADGTIEGMIDVSSSQEIVGDKTFASTITSSADVMLSGSGKVSASFFYGDGSSLSGVSGVPAGTDGNIQFTDGSALGASSNLTFFTSSNKLEVLGEISASVNVSASAFYGDGANLTFVTASFVTASSISGLVEANQIKRAPGLSNDAGFLTIDTASNGGITISSGLAIDANDLPSAAWSSDGDTIVGYIGGNTRKIEFGELTDHLPINANNIDSGTLLNARLPTTIDISVVSASTGISGAYFQGDGSGLTGVTGTPTPGGANTEIQFNDDGVLTGAPDLTFSTASFTLATVNISASGYVTASSYAVEGGTVIDGNADITCGNITMQDGVGTLNFGDNEVSGSGNISGSQFYGDGSTLSNLPVGTYSNYTENRILAAGGASDEIKGLSAVTFNNPTLNVVGNVSASAAISASSAHLAEGMNIGGETIFNSQGNIIGTSATAVITIADNPTNGDTLSFGDSTITPVVVSTYNTRGTGDDIAIGVSAAATRTNTKTKLESLHNVSVTINGNDLEIINNNLGLIGNRTISETFTSANNSVSGFTGGYSIDIYANDITASSFSSPDGTLISAEGDFQGNNASFNEITASSVISSSAEISASSFHGDGSALTNISATPQYRYQYINSVVKINTNLVTANSFQLFPADADGIGQSSDRTTHFVMPGSGSIERVIMSPSFYNTNGSGANVFTTSHSPQFFVRKNDISDGTPISGIALQMTASSANMKPLDLPNNAGTLNTQVVIFDVANNSPVITGSNSFDPGDILIFSGRNDVVVSDVAITIVLKIEEAGVTYP